MPSRIHTDYVNAKKNFEEAVLPRCLKGKWIE